ncbi:MAG TPA: hopanoid biosynthesis-associated protein HpnK [Nitrospira sp.]
MRQLIVTGDDFGLAIPVNEAIEQAHRHGILTTASLIVGAAAAWDAIERARRLPTLRVGLHLVLVEGRPVLPASEVPDLVDRQGNFSSHLVTAGCNFFFRPAVKRQLWAEIHAQFEAFHRTGFQLDHVNAHNHMHLHPTILALILKIGKEFGLHAIRLPHEPLMPSWRAAGSGFVSRLLSWMALAPWTHFLKMKIRMSGVRTNDFVFGLHDSGHLTARLVQGFLQHLPPGVTEIYFHPATRRCPEIDDTMPDYEHERELAALMNEDIKRLVSASGIQHVAFSEL